MFGSSHLRHKKTAARIAPGGCGLPAAPADLFDRPCGVPKAPVVLVGAHPSRRLLEVPLAAVIEAHVEAFLELIQGDRVSASVAEELVLQPANKTKLDGANGRKDRFV